MSDLIVSEVVLGWPLQAEAARVGNDWLVCITGGCAHHIGSVSTAWPADSEPIVQTITVPGHRDNAVSERFARVLAASLRSVVCVTCGIHYDGIDRSGIEAVFAASDRLLARLTDLLAQ